MLTICSKCGKPIEWIDDDWSAPDGTACGADVVYDSAGDPVIGHHSP